MNFSSNIRSLWVTFNFLVLVCTVLLSGHVYAQSDDDPHLWLEGIDEESALQWVEKTNHITEQSLASDPLYQDIYQDALAALNSRDKLPDITLRGDWVYYLKKDQQHPRGIYLRSLVSAFRLGKPKWQTVLDIDQLSKDENSKWVFHGMDCYAPENKRCLMYLSPGGGDAHEMREFDLTTLSFVENGFRLPTSKMNVTWRDENSLYVGTDFGPSSMTESGYPRQIRVWQRNTPPQSASTVFEVPLQSVWAVASRYKTEKGPVDLFVDGIDYWNRQYYLLVDGKRVALTLPTSAIIIDMIADKFVIQLQQDWITGQAKFTQGSVLIAEPGALLPEKAETGQIELLAASTRSAIIEDVAVSEKNIIVTILEDVKSRLYSYQQDKQGWTATRIQLPTSGQLVVQTLNSQSGAFFARYEGFLTPPSLYSVDENLNTKLVLQQSATFDSSDLMVEQYFAKSADGTFVPYFVVMNKDLKFDRTNPTHIFSYGGFRASLTPSYSGSYEDHNGIYGKAWLERGGVFVLANIRGGAEYGPAWHAAALRENRVRAFEDFEAVATDLATRRITSPKHLGIEGRSNGGLLVLATMIRRPELYGAVICGMPLADMRRYNKLLAGASWMAEYGNPDTDDWEFIKTYSPYQNISAKDDYPPVYFFTATRDDRVHPGHARKMAARMKAMGHEVEYFENTEGGHKGSATSEQTAKRVALGFTHLWRHLK